jgi:hypothetical protein
MRASLESLQNDFAMPENDFNRHASRAKSAYADSHACKP